MTEAANLKAKELIEKFSPCADGFNSTNDGWWSDDDEITKEKNAKACAVILCDEMIQQLNDLPQYITEPRTCEFIDKEKSFWQEIKTILTNKE